jgi:FMN phosphatase YigB (HAD superfamily)
MSKKIILWDLDGTLSDSTWRLPLIKNKPKNWKMFMQESINDNPIPQTLFLFQLMLSLPDTVSLIVTARSEKERPQTETWLTKNDLHYTEMFMRKDKDFRPDWEVKRELVDEIVEKYGPIFMAFDDRPNVIKNCYNEKSVYVMDVGQGITE